MKISYAVVLFGILAGMSEAALSSERNSQESLVGAIDKGQMGRFTISPDGMRVAYVAAASGEPFDPEEDENRKIVVILDGKKSKSYDYAHTTDDELIFSADSKRLAYRAYRNQKVIAVVDGHESDSCGKGINRAPCTTVVGLQFSPDSSHYAYVADSEGYGPDFVVVDGKRGTPYKNVKRITFSPDGKRMGYVVSTGNGDFVVVDGQEGKRHEHMSDGIVFSPDSKRFAYTAGRLGPDRHHFVVVGDQEGKRYAGVGSGPRFSPDSQRVSYVAQVGPGMTWSVVVDGQEGRHYSGTIPNPIFSPDSLHVSYVASVSAKSNSEQFLVLDGQEMQRFSKVDFSSFSPDSKRIAYRVRTTDEKKWLAVIDEKIGKQYDSVSKIIFSPDSAHAAYMASVGSEQFVVLDGEEGRHYDRIANLAFAPDSDALVYVAYSDKERKWFVVVNGQEWKRYDQILSSDKYWPSGNVYFDGAGGLHYLVVKDKRDIYVVKEKYK